MNTPILTFFNNKGGVGKTSLVYHLAWMYSSLRKRVLLVDLDPQTNLTAALLKEEEIEAIWDSQTPDSTIYQCVKPLTDVGDVIEPTLQKISDDLYLIPGDAALASFEDYLSDEWPKSLNDRNLYRPMRILSSFWQVMMMGAKKIEADLIIVDVGPNLGAINRSVLIATDYVAIPLAADLFSLQGLQNLGPTLSSWHKSWRKRLDNWRESSEKSQYKGLQLPEGKMQPIGYLCQQPSIRLDRPVRAYDKWFHKMPSAYRTFVMNQAQAQIPDPDPECLATIKHYRSLIPMGQEHRKPIFFLTPADGASGSHANAVHTARQDFQTLAMKIAGKIGLEISNG